MAHCKKCNSILDKFEMETCDACLDNLYIDVEDEILYLLGEIIIEQVAVMRKDYTVAEIAREVLLVSRKKEY